MKVITVTPEVFDKLKSVIDEKNEYHEKIRSGWRVKTKKESGSVKLMIP